MNPQPTFPTSPGAWRRQILGLLLGLGLIGLMLRFIDDFPEAQQRPVFFLGLLLANGLIYLLVTRRRATPDAAGAERRLAAVGLLLHVLSAAVVVLVTVFIVLGINPH